VSKQLTIGDLAKFFSELSESIGPNTEAATLGASGRIALTTDMIKLEQADQGAPRPEGVNGEDWFLIGHTGTASE